MDNRWIKKCCQKICVREAAVSRSGAFMFHTAPPELKLARVATGRARTVPGAAQRTVLASPLAHPGGRQTPIRHTKKTKGYPQKRRQMPRRTVRAARLRGGVCGM